MKKITLTAAFLALALASGCSDRPNEPNSQPALASTRTSTGSAGPAAAPAADVVRGFALAAQHSAFHLGNVIEETDQGDIHRIVGEHGVVAIHNKTSGFLAVPNAGAPSRAKPSLFKTGAEHDAFTKNHFLTRGLPADQIGEVRTHTLMVNRGSLRDLGNASLVDRADSVRFTTVITRQIDGIPVPDSYAWASFDADGAATSEEVFWPEIPVEAVREAKLMLPRAEELHAKARESLEVAPAQQGAVTLRHGGWRDVDHPTFASFDVTTVERGVATTHHFDGRGERFQMPMELRAPAVADKR
jgi:hypothetical protein